MRLALIHTVPGLVETFSQLADELLDGSTEVVHTVDQSLLADAMAGDGLSPAIARRVATQVHAAEDAAASAILVTCSSVGPAVTATRPFCSVPLLRVDEAMIDTALDRGTTIGVLGTLRTTLAPTTELVAARAAGRQARVVSRLCEGAFDALSAGDVEEHDRRVRDGLRALVAESDVVVLAQASMARVAGQLGEADTEILSSPRLSMEQAARTLLERRTEATA